MKHTKATATNASMGTVSGSKSGLESGLAEVQKIDGGKSIEVCDKTDRPKCSRGQKAT